jgi:hypothetical protein
MTPTGKLTAEQIAGVVSNGGGAGSEGPARGRPVAIFPPYHFAAAFPAQHFVSEYVTYAAERTDAALEYHELGGLILLAMSTPAIRAQLAPYPGGLPTNLYGIIIGESTVSRKSTAKALVQEIQACVDSASLLADQSSPEAFVEQLARRSRRTSLWSVDEFADSLDKIHHAKYMAGMKGLLLQVYGGGSYRAQRHSKRKGKGAAQTKEEDLDVIEEPHLSILGTATPGLFDRLEQGDVLSGLLPRFAVVMPTTKPPRRPFFQAAEDPQVSQASLVACLHRLLAWCPDGPRRAVTFQPAALQVIDAYAEQMEQRSGALEDTAKAMLQRLVPMALKVAMLAACGRPTVHQADGLLVGLEDARAALHVIQRWEGYALAFAERIGENRFERDLRRCVRVVEGRGRIPRRIIAKTVHLDKRTLDLVEATLVDRGVIKTQSEPAASGPATVIWEWSR